MPELADDTRSRSAKSPTAAMNGPISLSAVNRWMPHDIVMRDTWFPVAHDYSLAGKVIRRAVYSNPVFLWREEGLVVASEFNPNEQIAHQKSDYTDRQGRYPVLEHYGVIWIWFGNPKAADPRHLPNLPFLPSKGGLPRYMTATIRFPSAAPLSLENLIDLTHADFLHADVIGDEKSDGETVETFFDSETVTMVRTIKNKSVAPVMKFFSGIKQPTQNVRMVTRIYLRSHCAIAYGRYDPGEDTPLFHPCTPETRDRARMEMVMNTSHAGFLFRHIFPRAAYKISRQDAIMTTPQSAEYMRQTDRKDLHSPFDEPGQRYRMGMIGIADRQTKGDFAYHDDVSADCSDMIGLTRTQIVT